MKKILVKGTRTPRSSDDGFESPDTAMEFVVSRAEKIYSTYENHDPLAIVVQKKEVFVFALGKFFEGDESLKDECREFLVSAGRDENTEAIMFICEGWMANADKVAPGQSVSEVSEKTEVLMISAEWKNGPKIFKMLEIKREEIVRLVDANPSNDQHLDMTGRFVSFFDETQGKVLH